MKQIILHTGPAWGEPKPARMSQWTRHDWALDFINHGQGYLSADAKRLWIGVFTLVDDAGVFLPGRCPAKAICEHAGLDWKSKRARVAARELTAKGFQRSNGGPSWTLSPLPQGTGQGAHDG